MVDPVAVTGILVAVLMMVVMIVGAISIHNAWTQYGRMSAYVETLTEKNVQLQQDYHSGYELNDIREKALALGMIPAEEAETIQVMVHMPVVEAEPTWWEDLVWFVDGLIE
jgi:hypothetical protein